MSTEKEILALEDRRCAAMTAGDLASLEKLLHDELLYTHSSGVTDTKASWQLSMKSGKTRCKSVKCSDQQVRVFGDVALVTGRVHIEAEINGQPMTLRLMFLNAWAKTPPVVRFPGRGGAMLKVPHRDIRARGRVRYVGKEIALVVATSAPAAQDAAERLDIEYR